MQQRENVSTLCIVQGKFIATQFGRRYPSLENHIVGRKIGRTHARVKSVRIVRSNDSSQSLVDIKYILYEAFAQRKYGQG
jgi:hypothetical protein